MSHKTTLKILLILSLISAVGSFISYFMMATMMPFLQNYYATHPGILPSQMLAVWERMLEIPRPYYAAAALLYVLEAVGCILMWKLHRSGFHSYALSQLLLLLLPMLFLGKGFVGLGDIMMTLLFLFIYYMLLKSLGVFGAREEDSSGTEDPEV